MADSPQLPETTEPAARVEAVADADLISIREAENLFQIDASTIRRRLKREEVRGARLVAGPKGEEWRFPADSLDSLGYTRKAGISAAVTPQPAVGVASVEKALDELSKQLAEMRQKLNLEQKQLEQRTEEKAKAEVEIGRLQEREKALQERLAEREKQAEERYEEALGLSYRERRRRRKALREGGGEG
jgi:TolA-binding protein